MKLLPEQVLLILMYEIQDVCSSEEVNNAVVDLERYIQENWTRTVGI